MMYHTKTVMQGFSVHAHRLHARLNRQRKKTGGLGVEPPIGASQRGSVRSQDTTITTQHVREAFGSPLVTFDRTPDPAHEAEYHAGESLEAACLTLHLQPRAPVLLSEAARRTLARLHHPDAGGTDKAMAALTAAVDLLLAAAHTGSSAWTGVPLRRVRLCHKALSALQGFTEWSPRRR